MSVQFGVWNFEGQQPAADYIEKVGTTLAPYGPDSNESYSSGGVRILYRAFHTTKESRGEVQPHICLSGTVLTWDGRLDNRADLIGELRDSLTADSTDVAIVATAYGKWGADCLGKLVGDWALSVWNPQDRSVLLAKDHIGTKHLYYSYDDKQLTWSTLLDPLVLFAGRTFEVCEEYIAGWLAIPVFPAAHLTPYVGVNAVPPSSSVLLRPGARSVCKYWNFDPDKRIRYRTDAEYEEHFRSALAAAVQCRLRSDRPILAELSGGMDSSAIVCLADNVIARGAECTGLDTISWFDDSYEHIEPDTNELHWVSKVERKRNRIGFHLNTGVLRQSGDERSQKSLGLEFDSNHFAATPRRNNDESPFFKQWKACVKSKGYLVTLSGIGGDEATGGGVPTPIPEFQDLVTRARFVTLSRQLNAWAERMSKPRLALLWHALQALLSAHAVEWIETCPLFWLRRDFVRRNRAALSGYPSRVKVFGPLPSFQDHLNKLDNNRRFVAYCSLHSDPLREIRYPYYDRNFLEFMYAIPREQIVRIGQRRSLMKRALVDVVPTDLLNRRRKAFTPPNLLRKTYSTFSDLTGICHDMVSASIGMIDSDRLCEHVRKTQFDENVCDEGLKRTVRLESWLRHLAMIGVLAQSTATEKTNNSPAIGSCEPSLRCPQDFS